MARIDFFLNSIGRFGASGAVLRSGANVTLRFRNGDRHASQTTSHADLIAIVEETAPTSLLVAVKRGQPVRFEHTLNAQVFQIEVEPRPDRWTIRIGAPTGEAGLPMPQATPQPAEQLADHLGRVRLGTVKSVPAVPRPGASAPPPVPPPSAGPPRPPSATATMASVAGVAPATPGAVDRSTLGAIDRLLVRMKEMGASDLHLTTGSPPIVRLHGEMTRLEAPPFDGGTLLAQLLEITPERNRREYEERNDTDFGHAIAGVSRFRGNLFRDRNGPGAVFRAIPFEILTPDQIGLPEQVLELCRLTKGLVLVTGPTGSGKSTTLASLVDHINRNRADHIITVEDPIEFVHESKRCLVNQREVRMHTGSFKDALRAALREDPDIVLVGEMRDLETIAIAVETAETGHLVFGTLHTTTAPSTVDRIIDQFPADRQGQIRTMLAESLRGVIAQTLCKKIGGGRIAAYEILMGSSAVSNVVREGKTFQLFSLMQTGRSHGMITLNDSLLDLVRRKLIEPREALLRSVSKAELRTNLLREGIQVELSEAA